MHKNSALLRLLQDLDLGSSIAEQDAVLESSRVETSAFSDLLNDKVDLIPGTKGSGKSALFRIFTDFLPAALLDRRKIVIAHGVHKSGDTVFHAFKDQFEKLSEDDFVEFWCIYFISLAQEQFIKSPRFGRNLLLVKGDVERFKRACSDAGIPQLEGKKSLRKVLEWALAVLKAVRPTVRYKLPNENGEMELELFDPKELQKSLGAAAQKAEPLSTFPTYFDEVREILEEILGKTNLSLWLMVDKLDELFPRRSPMETRALRGLLRVTRVLSSERIRLKIFLRDDMLADLVSSGEGFTALTHVTARQSDTLRWSQDQIIDVIVKRIFANIKIAAHFGIFPIQFGKGKEYRSRAFYCVFPATVHRGSAPVTVKR